MESIFWADAKRILGDERMQILIEDALATADAEHAELAALAHEQQAAAAETVARLERSAAANSISRHLGTRLDASVLTDMLAPAPQRRTRTRTRRASTRV